MGAAEPADVALDAALLMGPGDARFTEERLEPVVRSERHEPVVLEAIAALQDPGHRGLQVVVTDPQRHPVEARDDMIVEMKNGLAAGWFVELHDGDAISAERCFRRLGDLLDQRQKFGEHGRVGVYFEAAAIIVSLTLLGQVLELKARSSTSAAIKALPLRLGAARPLAEAISTAGGVAFDALGDGQGLRPDRAPCARPPASAPSWPPRSTRTPWSTPSPAPAPKPPTASFRTAIPSGTVPSRPPNTHTAVRTVSGLVKAASVSVSYTHLRAHETVLDLVCRLLLEKQKEHQQPLLRETHIITPT